MPKVGLSRPYAAVYHEDGAGTVTYSGGVRAGRAVEYSLSMNSGGDNDFYADNALAESAGGTFTGGTLGWTVAELEAGISRLILGLKEEKITVDGSPVTMLVYDEDMAPPYMGAGIIVKSIVRGVTKWRAVVLTKVKWNIPEDAATTQGESVDWQTDEIEATIMRDDTSKHVWRKDAVFDSESKADAFIRHILNIKESGLDSLTVTAAAGTSAGKAAITVTPALTEGRRYKVRAGGSKAPGLYEDLSGWESWDGVSEVSAAVGDTVYVAETDVLNLCMGCGSAVVAASGD